jgi:quercetin dioxygenase-like cupin family protein
MNFASRVRAAGAAAIFCAGAIASNPARPQASAAISDQKPKERGRVVFSHPLPALDGSRLKATVVEVNYGPGESSPPHSHPCAVIGYLLEGSIRTQVKGEPAQTIHAGGSFYEAPNGVHLVSANASQIQPARLLAYFVCDHDAALSTNMPAPATPEEK